MGNLGIHIVAQGPGWNVGIRAVWVPSMPIEGAICIGTNLGDELTSHLEERLLDQAQAQASYTPPPFFRVVRVAYPNVWFLTSNPL